MAIKFNQSVLHERTRFLPGVAVAFEDPDAEPYFTSLGWAEPTDEAPAHTYSAEEVSIDPLTRVAETGQFVLPERAAAATTAQEG